MQKNILKSISIIILFSLLLTACSASPEKKSQSSSSQHLSVKNKSSKIENYDFKINYYKVPSSIRILMSNEYYEAYTKFVDAYLNYETQSDCRNVNLDDPFFWGIVIMCFPIFHSDTKNAQYHDGVISWEYTTTLEEHQKIISAFETQIDDYFGCLKKGDSEIIKALSLYQNYTSQINYDYNLYNDGNWLTETTFSNSDGYHGLMDKTGICQSFSWAYCFLLTQADIDNFSVAGESLSQGNHQWTMLKIDGKWYFADPTWDANIKTLKNFGQTMDERENDGFIVDRMCYLSSDIYLVHEKFDLNDNRFRKLHILGDGEIMLSYKINRISNSIRYLIMDKDGVESERSFPLSSN